ncbi:MAG: dockerin type I domain-containing protein, partial [Chthoniobacterales bacterium]
VTCFEARNSLLFWGFATSGMGQVDAVTINGSVVTVNLSNVANAQTLTLKIFSVSDGANTGDVSSPMSVLLGDTNANGVVNAADISQTKSQSGQSLGASNFREDVNANGSINAVDISIVKVHSGTGLS